jgi:iron(III) transport system substrate-binding protein
MDKDRMMKPMRAGFTRFILYNTNLVKEGELNSLQDLLDPKWKGRIVMGDPTRPGTASGMLTFLEGIWGPEKTEKFLRQLVKQEPVITRESRVPVEGVARGKYAIGLAMRAEPLPEFVKLGAPVKLAKLAEGCYMTPGAGIMAVANRRPHPNATAVFVNWILTKEGQTVWSKGDEHATARLDVSTEWVHPIFLPFPGERVFEENEEVIKKRAGLVKLAKEIFAPLLK